MGHPQFNDSYFIGLLFCRYDLHKILKTNLLWCWVCMFDTQKVQEMRNIGLASIEVVRPQLDQNSSTLQNAPACTSTISGHFIHWWPFYGTPCPRIWTLLPHFAKKACKPVVPIGLLLLLPKKSLQWVKKHHFLSGSKNMNFNRKMVENVWYSRAFISKV